MRKQEVGRNEGRNRRQGKLEEGEKERKRRTGKRQAGRAYGKLGKEEEKEARVREE